MIAAASGWVAASARRDHLEDPAHQEAVTARLEGADGTAAELEGGSPVVYKKCEPGGPDQVEGALIAERRAERETLAQTGTSAVGVCLDDGRADGEQAARLAATRATDKGAT
jgi:hypothetical protein